MRHRLTTRFVVVVAVLLLAAALLWSALAATVVDAERQARTQEMLELAGRLEPDIADLAALLHEQARD